MSFKRVIPCLDVKGGRVVKGVNFVALKDAGDPVEMAAVYDKSGADELVFLDITATSEERPAMLDVASKTAEQVTIPFIVGGGMRSVDDMVRMREAGADKVSINSAAYANPDLIGQAARSFGRNSLVIAVDARKVPGSQPARWELFVSGGKTNTGLNAIDWALEAAKRGAGEILLTSMDMDGVKDGYDIDLYRALTSKIDLPVIASGGAGKIDHFLEVIVEAGVDAVLAASVFHFNEISIAELKEAMQSAGIPVRLKREDF